MTHSKFTAVLILSFCISCLNFFDILAIVNGFWVLFKNFWMLSFWESSSANLPFFHRSKPCFKTSWCSFDLEDLERFWSKKFGIIMMALNGIYFNGDSLGHLLKSLVISSIYRLPHTPDDKRKIFYSKKMILLYMEYIVLKLIILAFCDQVYSIAMFTISLNVEG